MSASEEGQIYVYKIDEDDRIVYVSDNWLTFALENEGIDRCAPSFVLGKLLWHFISDGETRHLYKVLLQKVRSQQSPVTIPINCDSPDLRRWIEITILPLPDKAVEFRSEIIRTEPRDPVDLLSTTVDRSEEFIKICSFCKKIAISNNEWVDTDKAIEGLDLFESSKLPQLTHGVCPACHKSVIAELK
jgi:hypothetical protein